MATENTSNMATENTSNNPERRDVFIDKGYVNDEPMQFVSVNGYNYTLPKGETSRVPAHIADEIERSRRAQRKQDKNAEQLLEKAKLPIQYK